MGKQVMLVDPDPATLGLVRDTLHTLADIDGCTDFQTARSRLLDTDPDLLVVSLRLRAYNGLHLVYLAATTGLSTRSVVYADAQDLLLAREVQTAGAFFELKQRLLAALPGYVRGRLPPHDRRDPGLFERRRVLRGGRRCADISVIAYP